MAGFEGREAEVAGQVSQNEHNFVSQAEEFIQKALLLLLLSRFSRVRPCVTRDGSSPGFAIPGILQARTLEWVAISFSNA